MEVSGHRGLRLNPSRAAEWWPGQGSDTSVSVLSGRWAHGPPQDCGEGSM